MRSKVAPLWTVYALLMGFALGGSFVSTYLGPEATTNYRCAAGEQERPECQSPEERHYATEAALGYYTKWLMVYTGVMAFATIGLGIATLGLYWSGEDTAQRELRAYLWGHTTPLPKIDGQFSIHTKIKNSGRTPAYEVHSWTFTDVLPRPLPEGHQFEKGTPPRDYPRFVVNPESEHGMNTMREKPFDQTEIASIMAGANEIYYWGEILYRDAFNHNRYCRFRLAWTSSVGLTHGMWRYCENGNEAN